MPLIARHECASKRERWTAWDVIINFRACRQSLFYYKFDPPSGILKMYELWIETVKEGILDSLLKGGWKGILTVEKKVSGVRSQKLVGYKGINLLL